MQNFHSKSFQSTGSRATVAGNVGRIWWKRRGGVAETAYSVMQSLVMSDLRVSMKEPLAWGGKWVARGVQVLATLLVTWALSVQGVTTQPVFQTDYRSPTADKPQSKLWFVHDTWWALLPTATGPSLWQRTPAGWHEQPAVRQTFAGLPGRCDVWSDRDGVTAIGVEKDRLAVMRLRGEGKTPVTWHTEILASWKVPTAGPLETATITRDATGAWWIAAPVTPESDAEPVVAKAGGKARPPRTVQVWYSPDARAWTALPPLATGIGGDDICVVTAVEGGVGVAWSDQNRDEVCFRVHRDGRAPSDWEPVELVASGGLTADDHLNVAQAAGKLWLATKNSVDTAGQPQLVLRVRSADGSWQNFPYGEKTVARTPSRPIVVATPDGCSLLLGQTDYASEGAGQDVITFGAMDVATKSVAPTMTTVISPDPALRARVNDVTGPKAAFPVSGPWIVLASDEAGRVYEADLRPLADAAGVSLAVSPGASASMAVTAELSPLRSFFVPVSRVVWQSGSGVTRAESLVGRQPGQALLKRPSAPCVLAPAANGAAGGGVLLDFGTELAGHVEIITARIKSKVPPQVRIRFGESVAEAMAELGGPTNAQNDHALRDQVVRLPWLGKTTVGPSGFRFVRIDNVDPTQPVQLGEVRAVLQLRDVPYVGSFRCDDERLNRIWQVGAYTVHLNMQDYLWDGVKRDRLVWIGDMHPEVSTINAVFGFNDVVPRSLDLTRDVTPPDQWMNGISSYSMWWVLIHEQWWKHHGDRAYLVAQKPYLQALLARLAALVGQDGKEQIAGSRFLDWPTSANPQGVTAGLQALLVMTLESGARLMTELDDPATARLCSTAAARGRGFVPEVNASKAGAALLAIAGMRDAKETSESVLKVGGPTNISTFYGFYVLQALALAGETDTALNFISRYWGAMLDLGATTFWEDFDIAWTENAARIDELVPADKKDIHGGYGAYCYVGFRHSLCHGWASGPTAWLSETVLGVTVLQPGCKRVRIAPQLGRLKWAEGTYPTPHGPIRLRHERRADGSVHSQIDAPAGVEIVREEGNR